MSQFHILSKPGCPACTRAKAAIERAGFTYSERVYNTPELVDEFKAAGFRSFPQVYHGKELIGTADQTEVYLKTLQADEDDF